VVIGTGVTGEIVKNTKNARKNFIRITGSTSVTIITGAIHPQAIQ
jgi:hypothetical protein